MNIYFLMYEFISGGAMCDVTLFGGTSHINTAYHHCRDAYGNREFAELMAQACQYTREDMEREHHEGFPSEREWARGIDCD